MQGIALVIILLCGLAISILIIVKSYRRPGELRPSKRRPKNNQYYSFDTDSPHKGYFGRTTWNSQIIQRSIGIRLIQD
jgi:hypothetical protein